jgi:hypothetical protein
LHPLSNFKHEAAGKKVQVTILTVTSEMMYCEDIIATIKRFCVKSLEIAAAQTEIARHSESGHES